MAPGSPALGTRHLLVQAAPHLLGDDHLLHLLKQVLGICQMQPERLEVRVVTFDLDHLVHGGRSVVIGFDDDLHAHPHAARTVDATVSSVRRRLTSRRSQRSISSQRCNCSTSS